MYSQNCSILLRLGQSTNHMWHGTSMLPMVWILAQIVSKLRLKGPLLQGWNHRGLGITVWGLGTICYNLIRKIRDSQKLALAHTNYNVKYSSFEVIIRLSVNDS